MALEIKGTIHAIFDTAQVSDKFRKREFVVSIADNPKYPQLVQFQVTGDRIAQLDEVGVGDKVRIEFSLRGREWKSPRGEVRYFNSLDAWLVDVTERTAPQSHGQRRTGGAGDDRPPPVPAGPTDDLPFGDCSLAAEPSALAPVLRRAI